MAVKLAGKNNKELAEERANLITNARQFLETNEAKWSDDHDAQYQAMLKDASDIKAAIERRQRLEEAGTVEGVEEPHGQQRGVQLQHDPRPGRRETPKIAIRQGWGRDLKYVEEPIGDRGKQDYREAFNLALRHGRSKLTPAQFAALQSDDADQAGYLVASEQFAAGLLRDVDDLLFVRRYARIHTVREADSLGIRKRTSKASTFDWSSELAVSTEDSSLTFGKKVLTPHHLTGMIKVSRDLIRRSALDVEMIIREEMALDAAEVLETAYLTGSGAQQPLGVFTASSDGISTTRDQATSSTTSIDADSLRSAKYKMKQQHRAGARWLFHRDAIAIISKLVTGDGTNAAKQYLWQPGMTLGDPDLLLGMPVDESEKAPNTFTAGLYVGLLANWRYYEIADALDLDMQVLLELYAATNQVGYIGRIKTDGMPTLEEGFVRLKTAAA